MEFNDRRRQITQR